MSAARDLEELRHHCRFWFSVLGRVGVDVFSFAGVTWLLQWLDGWLTGVHLSAVNRFFAERFIFALDLVLWLILALYILNDVKKLLYRWWIEL
jgi:hypothetical protein